MLVSLPNWLLAVFLEVPGWLLFILWERTVGSPAERQHVHTTQPAQAQVLQRLRVGAELFLPALTPKTAFSAHHAERRVGAQGCGGAGLLPDI